MHISSAQFDRSAPDLASCPDESLPEFAFIGRSNVGKSSLLNMLAGRNGLARVSPTPGYTKLINFFTMNRKWRLVDLPGYGYAHVARTQMAEFNEAVMDYIEHRPNLKLVFAWIDSGLPPQRIDLEFMEWLTVKTIPFVPVFTKIDRIKPTQMKKNIQAFVTQLAEMELSMPEPHVCSSTTAKGRNNLLDLIEATIEAGRTQATEIAKPEATPPKPRIDRARPW